jgi:nitrile hydratase
MATRGTAGTRHTVATRYPVGGRVRVAETIRPGHIRTPLFLLGKRGEIAALQGEFLSPEQMAYHEEGPPIPLYLVAFEAGEVWGGQVPRADRGFKIYAELYEDWLSPL